ncbi:DUF5707 domain-containing protein [Streptomyces sp. NPDC050625]|uniref:DUF5707 domain-containing protein n=1 Tax=Streptomyces sp. NPDC050625 TaxID=3154629 RepID=UPI0034317CF9
MSRRIIVSGLAAVAVLGAAGAYAFVAQASEDGPAVKDSSAEYVAPATGHDGSISFTTRVTDDSGVRSVKVLAWPGSMKPAPTAKEMSAVESAMCTAAAGDGAATCRYTAKVSGTDAATAPRGTWHVAVLVTAKDGDTVFVPKAADFTVTR